MAIKRHRSGYKFTDKTQSKRGILAFVLAAISIIVLVLVIVASFQSRGDGTMYLGSAGVSSMLLSVVAFVVAIMSLGEENSYKFFPYLSTVLSFLVMGIWVALYVVGFMMG